MFINLPLFPSSLVHPFVCYLRSVARCSGSRAYPRKQSRNESITLHAQSCEKEIRKSFEMEWSRAYTPFELRGRIILLKKTSYELSLPSPRGPKRFTVDMNYTFIRSFQKSSSRYLPRSGKNLVRQQAQNK